MCALLCLGVAMMQQVHFNNGNFVFPEMCAGKENYLKFARCMISYDFLFYLCVSSTPIQDFHSRLTKSSIQFLVCFQTPGFNCFLIYLENTMALDIRDYPILASVLQGQKTGFLLGLNRN